MNKKEGRSKCAVSADNEKTPNVKKTWEHRGNHSSDLINPRSLQEPFHVKILLFLLSFLIFHIYI